MNPRNERRTDLGQAKEVEAERLQNELDNHLAQLGSILTATAKSPKPTVASAIRRIFTKHKPTDNKTDPTSTAEAILDSLPFPNSFPKHSTCLWLETSSMLAIDYTLPAPEVVPRISTYRYARSKGQIVAKARSDKEHRALYATAVAQTVVRCLYELFDALPETVETIAFNAFVETIDPATGNDVRPLITSVRVTRNQVVTLDLSRVDAVVCLRALGAVVSASPSELVPVRPVLDLSMIDKRFVNSDNVLADLSDAQDLMELTPNEFEHLITNLFEKMGLETRQTQASRDGGVDCVAFNHDPVLGGKVVIQAKRYRNTVGVSAVRDLYGTVQNEGASKGILVTTSGYGPAAYEFAKNKPLELFEGGHLLYLLREHTGVNATVRL